METQSAMYAPRLCIPCKEHITINDSTDSIILLRILQCEKKIRILWWLLLVWESVTFPSHL